jgi:hypothetical protein
MAAVAFLKSRAREPIGGTKENKENNRAASECNFDTSSFRINVIYH